MRPDEARKLLGGYATGTLTPEEQQALFAAALEDQELFDELAQEQVLRETLDDPGARAELLAAVTERKQWLAAVVAGSGGCRGSCAGGDHGCAYGSPAAAGGGPSGSERRETRGTAS